MSHYTHKYSEFRVSSVGKYENYILIFHIGDDNITRQFGSNLGINSVAIESEDSSIDFAWWLADNRPVWLNSHVFINSTILLIFSNKSSLVEFKKRFVTHTKQLIRYKNKDLISPFGIPNNLIVTIPRGYGRSNQLTTSLHDRILDGVAIRIKNGWDILDIIGNSETEISRLSEDFQVDVFNFDNTIIFDTTNHAIVLHNKLKKLYLQDVLKDIKDLRQTLANLNQNSKSNEVLRQLNEIRKMIADSANTGNPLSIQASAGIDFFGNGIKLAFDSSKLPNGKIDKIISKIRNYADDKIAPRKRLEQNKNSKNTTIKKNG